MSRDLAERVGFGDRTALLAIDLQLGTVAADDIIAAATEAARGASIPVIDMRCVWSASAVVWARRLPPLRQPARGFRWVEIDPRIRLQDNDIRVEKSVTSARFGPDSHVRLNELTDDTLLLTGVTTSGGVRAYAADGCSPGCRVVVAEEAVGDRAAKLHLMSLFDLDAKYANVRRCAEVEGCLTPVLPVMP